MPRCIALIAIFVWAPLLLVAQERPLSLQEVRDLPGVYNNPVFPVKCGPSGDLYVRLFNGSTNIPVSRIDPDKKTVTQFSLEGTRYFKHSHIWDFAPNRDGGLLQLIWYKIDDNHGYRILHFDADGKVTGDDSVDVSFDPMQLAVLGNDTIVVAGRESTDLGGHTGAPKVAIVSARGQLIKQLALSHDLKKPGTSAKSQKNTPEGPKDQAADGQDEYNYAIDFSDAESADDGNVYVLRKGTAGPLFSISPDGEVKEIRVPLNKEATVNAVVVSHGKALVHYVGRSDNYRQLDLGLYTMIDLDTLQRVADYRAETGPLSANNIPGCYDGSHVTFMKIAPKGKLSLLIGKLE